MSFSTTPWLKRAVISIPEDTFPNSEAFQLAMYWYNGAMNAGRMAGPPIMSAWQLTEHGAFATAALRELFGGEPDEGHPQTPRWERSRCLRYMYVEQGLGDFVQSSVCSEKHLTTYPTANTHTSKPIAVTIFFPALRRLRRCRRRCDCATPKISIKNLLHIPHHFFHQYL